MDPLKELAGFDAGLTLALIKNVGGRDVAMGIAGGDLSVTVEEAIKPLLDSHFRRIPPQDLKAKVKDANWSFRLERPELDEAVCVAALRRFHAAWGQDTGVTGAQLWIEAQRLMALLLADPRTANANNEGVVCLPVVVPRLEGKDLGADLERLVEAAGRSYQEAFLDRQFVNHNQGTLADQVKLAATGTWQERLFQRLEKGPAIGLYFPQALQGYSVLAAREQMSSLPEGFVLPGLDVAAAMTMWPDVLARDYHTPGLDLAALQWRSSGHSLDFGASDGGLGFGYTGSRAFAYDCYSGGLFFLG